MDPALVATAIGVGGTVIVGVAGFWANVRNTNKTTALALQGQVTDRYTKAIEQLGSKEIDVRIGGIYALERIARDSARDHSTVMEVLAAFVRDHSHEQWPLPVVYEPGTKPLERRTRPDVQAALTVIGRRIIRDDDPGPQIDLASADLTHAALTRANLTWAVLTDAELTGADLSYAKLTDADLTGANLTGADLRLAGLTGADLTGANLTGANLTIAYLTRADLTGANFTGATLTPAYLTGANLTEANFTRADLTGAPWPLDAEVPEGWRRDSRSGRLTRAETTSGDAAAQ